MINGQRAGLPLASLSVVARILATPRGACHADSSFGVRPRRPGTLTASTPAQVRADILDALKPIVGSTIRDVAVSVTTRHNSLTAVVEYVDVLTGQQVRTPGMQF